MRRLMIGLLLAGALFGAAVRAQQRPQDIELQAAIRTETVMADLKKAIAAYQAIVDRYAKTDRAMAADALLRMAECYRKLGDQQATRILERVMREFGDRPEAVQARALLNGPRNRPLAAFSSRVVWEPPNDAVIHGKTSPDGRYIPYLTDHLYLHDLVTGTNRQLTNVTGRSMQEAEYAEGSAFSRDGRQLAYAWRLRGRDVYQLRVIALEGGGMPAPRVIVDSDTIAWLAPFDWTPDGRSVALLVRRHDGTAQIALVSVATGGLRALKSMEWRGTSNLALSPDGRHLAFDLTDEKTRRRDVFVIATDASVERALVESSSDEALVGWSPDATRVLYVSDRTGSSDLWSIPVMGGKVGGEPSLLKRGVGQFWPMGTDTAGAVFGAMFSPPMAGKLQLTALKTVDGRSAGVTDVLDEFTGPATDVHWSPDGRSFVATGQWYGIRPLTPRYSDLMKMRFTVWDPLRRVPREIHTSLDYVNELEWARDGRSFIVAGADSRRRGIFRVDAQSGDTVLIARMAEDDEQPLLIPQEGAGDGTLYYKVNRISGRRSEAAKLMAVDLATGEQRDIIDYGPRDRFNILRISGDTLVRLEADPAARVERIVASRIDGTDARELIRVEAPQTFAAIGVQPVPKVIWAPDARSLVVVKASSCAQGAESCRSSEEAWQIPLTGTPVRIGVRPEEIRQARAFGWTDDGRSLLFARPAPAGSTEIWRWSLGGDATRLGISFNTAQPIVGARQSPDGRWVVYSVRDATPARSLEIVRFDANLSVPEKKSATSR